MWYPFHLYAAVHILDESLIPHQLRKYLIDHDFLYQKDVKALEYRIRWNVKYSKIWIYLW